MKVYFEERGRGMGKIHILAYVNPTGDGHAYTFNSNGKKCIFAWAHPKEARVYNHTELPKDLYYSIKHGSCDMHVPEEKRLRWEFDDLEYLKIDKEQVRATKIVHDKIKEVKTIDDFKKLYPHIKRCAYYIPECVYKLCELCGIGEVPMINGELGIAYYKQVFIYNALLKKIGLE